MKVNVNQATPFQLNWLVAKCEGFEGLVHYGGVVRSMLPHFGPELNYTTDWSQAGPIIEQERIATWFHTEYDCWCAASIEWMDADVESEEFLAMPDAFRGPTPLIAAMRCLVAQKLGDEVEVPENLK